MSLSEAFEVGINLISTLMLPRMAFEYGQICPCFVQKRLRNFALEAWQTHVDASAKEITAVHSTQVDRGVDRQVSWKNEFSFARRLCDCALKTR